VRKLCDPVDVREWPGGPSAGRVAAGARATPNQRVDIYLRAVARGRTRLIIHR